MVFAINAPSSGNKTFDAFVAKAANATHPDPALGVTAPFTPPSASPSNDTSGDLAPSTTDAGADPDPTDAPANVAPDVSSLATSYDMSATGTYGALNLSLGTGTSGGTAAQDLGPSTTGTTSATATTSRSSGSKLRTVGAVEVVLLTGTVLVGLIL